MTGLPRCIDGLPNVWGNEDLIAQAMGRGGPFYLDKPRKSIDEDAETILLQMEGQRL